MVGASVTVFEFVNDDDDEEDGEPVEDGERVKDDEREKEKETEAVGCRVTVEECVEVNV